MVDKAVEIEYNTHIKTNNGNKIMTTQEQIQSLNDQIQTLMKVRAHVALHSGLDMDWIKQESWDSMKDMNDPSMTADPVGESMIRVCEWSS